MRLRNYTELLKGHRKTDTVIFYGTGHSINDITREDWNILKQYDSMSLNWFMYHDFIVPRFYYRGENSGTVFGRKWKKLFNEKRGMYKNTTFLTKKQKHLDLKNVGVKQAYVLNFHNTFSKTMMKRLGPEKAYKKCLKGFKIIPNKLYFFGRSTVCPLLVLLYQMGYKEIILYGIDLNDRRYFWSDRKKSEVHWRWNRERMPKASIAERPHPNLDSTMYFVPYFNNCYMNGNIYVGSKKSALSEHLKYKSIEELK
jgi:hypothetical protein